MVVYGADITDLQKKLKTVEKDLKKASREIENSAKAWTKLAAPIAAFGVAAVASFQKVEAALNKVRVGTGATGNALKTLQNDFRAVAANSTSSLDTVATAVADLNTKLGIMGEPLQQLSAQMTNLSKISGESISGLADSVSRAFNIAKVSTEDYESTLDRLFTTSQNTGVSVTGLATTFAQFQPILAKFGLDINKSTVLIGSLEKSGYSASTVFGVLQTAMAKLAKNGVSNTSGELLKLIDKLQNTSNAHEQAATAAKLFGGNAQMMLQIIKSGALDVDTLTKSLYENTNSINKTALETETLSDKWQKVTNSFTVNGSAIGKSLNDLASMALDRVSASFKSMSGEGAETAVRIGLVATAIGPLQFAMSKLVGIAADVVGAFRNFTRTLEATGSITQAFSATLMGPAGIATALTAVAGILINQYIKSLQSAQAETAKLKKITDDLRASMALRTADERAQQKKQLQDEIAAREKEIKAAEQEYKEATKIDYSSDAAYFESQDRANVAQYDLPKKIKELQKARESLTAQLGEYTRFDTIEDFKKQLTNAKDVAEISKVWATIPLELRSELKGTADYAKSILTPASVGGTSSKTDTAAVSKFLSGNSASKSSSKSTTTNDAAKKAQEELRKQAEADRKIMDSIKSTYSDEDWNYQHKFTSGDEYFEQLKARFEEIEDLRRTGLSGDTAEQVDSIWKETVSSMQSFGDQFAGELKEKVEAGTISMRQAQEAAKGMVAQFTDNGIPVAGSELDKLAQGVDKAKEAMNQLNQAAAQTLGNLKTGLIDAIVEGGNFADTLSNVGKQLMKIALNSMITPWFNGIFRGLIGGVHTGGVIGIDPPSFVRSLPKFHTGGVVGANEQLAVLQTGEAVFTREQQKALGGLIHKDTSVKDITINITNNGSGNMSNEQAQQLAKQIKAYVKTEVADEMYTYNRQKMYSMG